MEKAYVYDFDDETSGSIFDGWMIKKGKENEVENVLSIPEQSRVVALDNLSDQIDSLHAEISETKEKLVNFIKTSFENAEYPDPVNEQPEAAKKFQEGYEKMIVEGIEYDHWGHAWSKHAIHGGGIKFVIQDKYIWRITNNGSDGDNWSVNNIQTHGAGAIGHRVAYDDNLASVIKTLCTVISK